jgi:hypothetical protein
MLTLSNRKRDSIPFNSETKRFDNCETMFDSNRGPGSYNSHNLFSIKPKKSKYDYFTSQKRFDHGSYLDKLRDKIPGPGFYEKGALEHTVLTNNKSFNLMYN